MACLVQYWQDFIKLENLKTMLLLPTEVGISLASK
jgi:hypothetical protein